MNGRLLAVSILCLTGGLIIGRLAPQADIQRLRTQLQDMKDGPSKRTSSKAAVQGVRSILNVSEQDMEKAQRIKMARQRMSNEAAQAETAVATGAISSTNAIGSTQRWENASSMSNNIDNLKKGWEMRAELARNNFIKKAELDPDAATQLDVLIEAMNLRLGATVDAWSTKLLEQGFVTEESGVRMMNELSQVMVLTYDEMDRKMPPEWREKAGPKFDLMRFIDPEVLTPLQELEHLDDATTHDHDHEDEE